MGTAAASPKQTETEKPKWVTMEEMERYERMIGRKYIRKGFPEEAKDFFFEITGMHPYQPASIACSEEQNLFQFEVQKYFRNKHTTVNKRDEHANQIESKQNLQVDSHVMRNGRWILADPMASFFRDVAEFQKEFSLDTTE